MTTRAPAVLKKGNMLLESFWDFLSHNCWVNLSNRTNTVVRYNEPCKDECLGRGYSYFWCNTLDNSWDYCSPKGDLNNFRKKKFSWNWPPLSCRYKTCHRKRGKALCRHVCVIFIFYLLSWYIPSKIVIKFTFLIQFHSCDTMGESYKWCAVISVHDDSIKVSY